MLAFIREWLPNAGRSPPSLVPATPDDFQTCAVPDGKRAVDAGTRRRKRPGWQADAVILALLREGRPLTVAELSVSMGCCRGESSKRIARCGDRVTKTKVGRHVLVAIAAAS